MKKIRINEGFSEKYAQFIEHNKFNVTDAVGTTGYLFLIWDNQLEAGIEAGSILNREQVQEIVDTILEMVSETEYNLKKGILTEEEIDEAISIEINGEKIEIRVDGKDWRKGILIIEAEAKNKRGGY